MCMRMRLCVFKVHRQEFVFIKRNRSNKNEQILFYLFIVVSNKILKKKL